MQNHCLCYTALDNATVSEMVGESCAPLHRNAMSVERHIQIQTISEMLKNWPEEEIAQTQEIRNWSIPKFTYRMMATNYICTTW